jgi:hypothetical protein
MFINSKQTVKIPTDSGDFVIKAGEFKHCPEKLRGHWYFVALCDDGTITFVNKSDDTTVENAARISAEKAAKEAERAERKRHIDAAKESARVAAEEEAKSKGMSAPDTKKLIQERQREAAESAAKEIDAAKEAARVAAEEENSDV